MYMYIGMCMCVCGSCVCSYGFVDRYQHMHVWHSPKFEVFVLLSLIALDA